VAVLTTGGGLGNQMFEWAAGLRVARELNLPYTWEREPPPASRPRDYGLGCFGLGLPPYRGLRFFTPPQAQGGEAAAPAAVAAGLLATPDSEFAVRGFFQSETCFLPVADEIRKFFRLEPFPLEVPEGKTPVGIQVRRGDYVKHKKLGILGNGYFSNAVNLVKSLVERPHFFMISDSPDWCVKNFGGPNLTIMPKQTAAEGLRVMVACRAHIISNSTYGWWGAWLGEDGPVVAPAKWVSCPEHYAFWKPVPDRWLRAPLEWIGRKRQGVKSPPPGVK
jgi:hypothetical protein